LAIVLLGSGTYLGRAHAAPAQTSTENQVCRAAKVLAANQGNFPNPRSGRQAIPYSWEWQVGDGVSAPNTGGVVAVALTTSPQSCQVDETLLEYARARVDDHQNGLFLYDPDVEALVRISERLGRPELRTVAHEAFQRRYEGANPDEVVARWRLMLHRGVLIGYDAALAIRAAMAVGERQFAIGLADETIRTYQSWCLADDTSGEVTISKGAMLEVLSELDAQRYAKPIEHWTHDLILTQGRDGSFVFHNTQATAYALAGLSRSAEPLAQIAVARGQRWLASTQLRDGSWASYNDHLPEPFVGPRINEVMAEALLALSR
jgi:hypothetical protein